MMTLEFKLCGLSIKRGWLFGSRDNPPLHTVNFLFVSAVIFSDDAWKKLREATRGLCSDPSWLIENSEEILAAKEHAVRRAREEYGERKDRHIEGLQKRLDAAHQENSRLQNENRTLRRAIEIVES